LVSLHWILANAVFALMALRLVVRKKIRHPSEADTGFKVLKKWRNLRIFPKSDGACYGRQWLGDGDNYGIAGDFVWRLWRSFARGFNDLSGQVVHDICASVFMLLILGHFTISLCVKPIFWAECGLANAKRVVILPKQLKWLTKP